ncbi:MAG: mechanosensitive ion channel family protein [Sphingosinicella sp.]|nr:mechanosensitive ion channel family protein [Sphingosinicella sp.]
MTQQNQAGVAEKFSGKIAHLFDEAGRWLTGNSVDILIATAIGVAIGLVLLAIRGLGCKWLKTGEGSTKWRIIFARTLARTSIFFIIMASAMLVAENAETPPAVFRVISILFVVAAAFQAAIWVRELILGYIEHRVGPDEAHSTLGSAVGIIRLLVTVALFAIAIILIFDNLGVNVTGLVAGLGIGGIAIGLAAQGIFSDLFAALSIIFDKPFRRGDGIRFENTTGTVEQIGLKTTRIRSLDGQEVIVSNAKLLDMQVHNFTNLEHRRIVLTFGLVYRTDLDLLARVPSLVRDIVDSHDRTTMVRCGMIGFGPSSLDFELLFDVHSADFEDVFATRAAICLEILKAFRDNKVEFAYPTQTTFTAAPDGNLVMPYAPVKTAVADAPSDPDIVQR